MNRQNGQNVQGGRRTGSKPSEGLILKHGSYSNLKSFQIEIIAYDVTVQFCDHYVDKFSQTKDQMLQATRSGVQYIAGDSMDSRTFRKTEIKLTNVVRSSLEELRLDYEDFLRHRGLSKWEWGDPHLATLINWRCATADEVAHWVQEINDGNGQHGRSGHGRPFIKSTMFTRSTYVEIAANAALVLIAVAFSLIDRQLFSQAEAFKKEGGFTERLYQRRVQARRKRCPV
jgi:four helix bundle suffix protein